MKTLSKDDVYEIILEKIIKGSFPIGEKLPACRTIAKGIGSNLSTVNRAIQKMAKEGIVISYARRGSFVANKILSTSDNKNNILENMQIVIRKAQNTGISEKNINKLFQISLQNTKINPKIAFAECNPFDLRRMSKIIENSTGIKVIPVLIDSVHKNWKDKWELIATPIFHISELRERITDPKGIIGLNFRPEMEILSKIAHIEKSTTVKVIAPTDRGIERMLSLVRQYFPGNILFAKSLFELGGSILDSEILISNRAAGISEKILAKIKNHIIIDWELDSESAEIFRKRIRTIYKNRSLINSKH